jgi:hypothetical protein
MDMLESGMMVPIENRSKKNDVEGFFCIKQLLLIAQINRRFILSGREFIEAQAQPHCSKRCHAPWPLTMGSLQRRLYPVDKLGSFMARCQCIKRRLMHCWVTTRTRTWLEIYFLPYIENIAMI